MIYKHLINSWQSFHSRLIVGYSGRQLFVSDVLKRVRKKKKKSRTVTIQIKAVDELIFCGSCSIIIYTINTFLADFFRHILPHLWSFCFVQRFDKTETSPSAFNLPMISDLAEVSLLSSTGDAKTC